MDIKITTNTNFKGYDARKVKGFFMGANFGGIVDDMQHIGRREGFKIYSKLNSDDTVICEEAISESLSYSMKNLWAQDIWTFVKNKLLTSESKIEAKPILKYFNLKNFDCDKHVSGGNMFITNNNGIDELFIGENELGKLTIRQLQEKYQVKTINILPQMDYHLDLFIRPLDQKRILIADDNLTLKILEKGKNEFLKFVEQNNLKNKPISKTILFSFKHLIETFQSNIQKNNLPQIDIIAKKISNMGYEPISIPGRIYQTHIYGGINPITFLSHDCNYMNANVIKNKDEELIYITNKSNIDKFLMLNSEFTKDFDFRFEKEFIKSLEPYVKPNKVYFIDGENSYVSTIMLKKLQGGIHCACSEIPY